MTGIYITWPAATLASVVVFCIFAFAHTALQGWLEIRKQPYVRKAVGDMEIELRGEPALMHQVSEIRITPPPPAATEDSA